MATPVAEQTTLPFQPDPAGPALWDQPARRSFGIDAVWIGGVPVPVRRRDLRQTPFYALAEFCRADIRPAQTVLLIAPLSGSFPFILREVVLGLLPKYRVCVSEWINARYVPARAGPFTLADNISSAACCMRDCGPDLHVFGLCQGVISALAATALLRLESAQPRLRSLTLLGGPVDPKVNLTPMNRLLRARPISWFENNVIRTVAPGYPGSGRQVYPAEIQFTGLMAYFGRHYRDGLELFYKFIDDDGIDPVRFPFMDLFSSVMDLPAEYFLDQIRQIFHEDALWTGALFAEGRTIDFEAVLMPPLMTVEAADDDIAAPGQTYAAHRLCPNVARDRRRHFLLRHGGHFSLFHGRSWRERIAPHVRAFLRANSSGED